LSVISCGGAAGTGPDGDIECAVRGDVAIRTLGRRPNDDVDVAPGEG
jgi:hypothetical protein